MNELRTLLRDETAAAHRRLDAALGQYRLDDVEDYAAFLAIQASVVVPLEIALEDAEIQAVLPDWPVRRRRTAVLEDLARLEHPFTSQAALAALPASDPATLLGIAYVLEGSRLGASYLIKQVAGAAAEATAYLQHGANDRLWPRFVAVLEANAAAAAAPDRLLIGATYAFGLFQSAAEGAASRTAN